ncbi:MAG: carbohydrate ABC transporter permease [Bacillota bacterium]|nr:carbohydrate ABC transporter permease [Bacillota bacterium]
MRAILVKTLVYLVLLVGSSALLTPFLWMVSTSLKGYDQVVASKFTWIPKPVVWSNYTRALEFIPFWRYLGNTVLVTSMCLIGALSASAVVAYGFAKLRAPGRTALFGVLLASMMLPGQVTMIPVFVLFQRLGWYNNLKALIIPAFLGGGAFNIFLLRQFYMTIPNELCDAAKIDGCSNLGILVRIVAPLSKPALTAVGVFIFVANWTDFFSPLIYLSDQEKYTLALGLRLFQSLHSTEYSLLMAASIVFSLPILVVFFLAQRYFIEGVTLTGMKG